MTVQRTSDRVMDLHYGGKLAIRRKVGVTTREDLAMVYTPGVARVSAAIAQTPQLAHMYTIKRNSVAVISDGSAVLGLGDIGPAGAMPVMEGKAILLKEFADVEAYPICLDERDPTGWSTSSRRCRSASAGSTWRRSPPPAASSRGQAAPARGTRPDLPAVRQADQPAAARGPKEVALVGADVLIGLSAANTFSVDQLELMAPDAIVFAMANPHAEIDPAVARRRAAVVATGSSNEPNQINNVLCFPGLFRGLLDAGACEVNDSMKLAAARAIADIVGADELNPHYIIPSPLDRAVVPAVAGAVMSAAEATGAVAPPPPPPPPPPSR